MRRRVVARREVPRSRGEGVGSYLPPLQARSLFLQVSVACSRARRNSRSAAAAFCASGVSGGIRPLGGSTITRRARAGVLHGHEHVVVGAGDVESVPRSRTLVAAEQCRSLLVQFGPLRLGEKFLVRKFGAGAAAACRFRRSKCPADRVRPTAFSAPRPPRAPAPTPA